MEFKKKTIIGEDNNEPPKNYIGVKSDGNAYEFNHTTRQGEKIMSYNESGSGSDSNSDVFFVPAYIQPKYFIDENNAEPVDINNYTSDIREATFLYNKEDIISLGIEEITLNSLTQVTIDEACDDNISDSPTKGVYIDKQVFKNKIILMVASKGNEYSSPYVQIYDFSTNAQYYLYKISDDIFLILEHSTIG